MMRPQPMVTNRDEQVCSRWFQGVLGAASRPDPSALLLPCRR